MTLSKFTLLTLLTVVATVTHLRPTAAQTQHTVGGTMGWAIPSPNSATNPYTTWASTQNITVGDSLLFNFATNAHDVAEVRQAAYGPCTIANPISTAMTGPAVVNMTTAGPHYFICTFGTHCSMGQKLMVNVSEATSSTPPSSTTMTPPPPGSTMTPPPSNGVPPSLTTVVPMALLAGVLVALF